MKSASPHDQGQALTDHLAELRDRLIKSAWIILLGGAICFLYSEQIFEIIRSPVAQFLPTGGLVYTGVVDKFTAHIKISLLTGLIVTSPLWFYQVWMFVAPALYRDEKKYAAIFLVSAVGLFLVGVLFVYNVVFPFAFEFLFNFGGTADKAMITIEEYLSFFTMTTLLFGLCFELPLILTILGMIGIVDSKFLREKRRYAIVILAAISAVITPPDALSMMFLLCPLVLLYEISILLVARFEKKREVSSQVETQKI